MRLYFFYLNQLMLIAVVLFAAVLPSFTSDRVPWGNSKNDGLYLLVIPLYLFPLVIFFLCLKHFW